MLKVIISECDPNAMLILKRELREVLSIYDIREACDGLELVHLIKEYKPDVLFLDIDVMINGLAVAQKISGIYPDVFLIITSQVGQYSREAVEIYAFDYLVKPWDLNRVKQTVERIKELRFRLDTGQHWSMTGNTRSFKLAIQLTNKIDFVNLSDIIMITRSERKTVIHTIQGIIKSNEPLQKFEGHLNPDNFFRCHKGYIINAKMVLEFAPWGNKTYIVKLANTNETALITLEKAKEFRAKYCL